MRAHQESNKAGLVPEDTIKADADGLIGGIVGGSIGGGIAGAIVGGISGYFISSTISVLRDAGYWFW